MCLERSSYQQEPLVTLEPLQGCLPLLACQKTPGSLCAVLIQQHPDVSKDLALQCSALAGSSESLADKNHSNMALRTSVQQAPGGIGRLL